MCSCFYESKKFFGCLMKREEKKPEDCESVFCKGIAKYFFVNMEKLFIADLRSNRLHEKVICYIIMLYY